MGQFDPKFPVEGGVPHQPFFVSEKVDEFSFHGIRMSAELSFVLSQFRQTDGQTDGSTILKTVLLAYNAAR